MAGGKFSVLSCREISSDLYANLFEISDHSLSPVTDLVVNRFEPQKIMELFANCPRLAAAVCWATARDEAILAEQVVRLGRRSAVERMTHLFLEIHKRLQLVGLAEPESFELPLTQEVIADLMGLSVVHVNRTLRQLRLRGLIEMKGKQVYFVAKDAAEDVAEFPASISSKQTCLTKRNRNWAETFRAPAEKWEPVFG